MVNDEVRRLRTEMQAERLHRARQNGGMCAACGRVLGDDETVYVEAFEDARGKWANRVTAPVGIECVSAELRLATSGRNPERCAGCGRPMYYGVERAGRQRALCCRAFSARAAKRQQAER